MKIIIVGSGFTGVQLAKVLVGEKNDVTLIDNNEEITRHAANNIDCTVITADGNNIETLEEAGIAKADALVCLTSSDEVNMITCSLVDSVYPNILKIARVRNYSYYTNRESATKSHSSTFKSGKHRPLYGIDYMIHPDVEAAEAITFATINGAVSNIITFDSSPMQISKITVMRGSVFSGHKLMEIRNLCDVKLLFVYVEKENETLLPQGNTIISEGCSIGVLTTKEDLPKVIELCGSKQKELKKIAIIGAGRIGTLVAQKLIEENKSNALSQTFFPKFVIKSKTSQKLLIIDSNEQAALKASERFPECNVCQGDATDEAFLREEGLPNFDLAICCTHNHELNMVLAAYLESLGVGQSISLVTSSAFAAIALKLGVDVTVALRDVVVDSIMSHLRGASVKEIHTITNGNLEIIECEVGEESKISGKKVKELPEHGKYLVLLDKHKDKSGYEITGGDTVITSGDHLVIISISSESKHVLEMFC